ncbi:MAG: HIT family protein [Lachnospiraceae bacterium]|nr:HIT family protein [Lachnospiraceae bacterium]
MKDDCIFCKLANGVIPTNSIYEDDDFKVILDASPATKGHALILPKEHYDDMYALPEEKAASVIKLAKKLMTHMTNVLKCDGFNIVQNNGTAAGQTVFHFHMHLIPRYNDDGGDEKFGWTHEDVDTEEQSKLCELLKTK